MTNEFTEFDVSSLESFDLCDHDTEQITQMKFEDYVTLCMTSYCEKCLKCPIKVLHKYSENVNKINKIYKKNKTTTSSKNCDSEDEEIDEDELEEIDEIDLQKKEIVNAMINYSNDDIICCYCNNICKSNNGEHLLNNIIFDPSFAIMYYRDMYHLNVFIYDHKRTMKYWEYHKMNITLNIKKTCNENVINKNIKHIILNMCTRYPYLIERLQKKKLLLTCSQTGKIYVNNGTLYHEVIRLKI
jgi:hypothetical protein